jgi:hypothetical protein
MQQTLTTKYGYLIKLQLPFSQAVEADKHILKALESLSSIV